MNDFVRHFGNVGFLGCIERVGDCAEGFPLMFYTGGGCVAGVFWDVLIGDYEKSEFRLVPFPRLMMCVSRTGGGRREV